MLVFSFFVFLQIVSESLPISSSGHILLVLDVIKSYDVCLFNDLFTLICQSDIIFALHAPTVFIILLFYAPRWIPLLPRFPAKIKLFFRIMGYVIAADSVTIVCYFMVRHIFPSLPLWVGFLITFFLLLFTQIKHTSLRSLQFHHFLLLGVVQGVAVLPGISRLAAVYATGYFLGLRSKKAFDVAWMLQLPLIVGASCLGWAQLIYQQKTDVLVSFSSLIAFFLGSCGGLMGLYAMYGLAARHKMWVIAWYIIVPLVLSFWYRW